MQLLRVYIFEVFIAATDISVGAKPPYDFSNLRVKCRESNFPPVPKGEFLTLHFTLRDCQIFSKPLPTYHKGVDTFEGLRQKCLSSRGHDFP